MSINSAVRHINEIRLLQALQKKGPLSRADIGRELDVMRSTAGNLVATLTADGLIRGHTPTQVDDNVRIAGRPGTLIELNPDHIWFLGADIGVGYVQLVAIDLQGRTRLSRRLTLATPQTPTAVVTAIVALVEEVRAIAPEGGLGQLCVSVPGLIDSSGTVRRAPLLGWQNVPLLSSLRDALPDFDIVGENDANAFAIAAANVIQGAESEVLVFLWLDAGVGGAVSINGKMLRGAHGFAGEFGHIGLHDNSSDTPLEGSVETVLGLDAILRASGCMDIAGFLGALDQSDPTAGQIAADWAKAMGRLLATLANIFDPSKFVFGGQVAPLVEKTTLTIEATLRGSLYDPDLVPAFHIATAGNEGAARGCAMLLNNAYLQVDENRVFGGQVALTS